MLKKLSFFVFSLGLSLSSSLQGLPEEEEMLGALGHAYRILQHIMEAPDVESRLSFGRKLLQNHENIYEKVRSAGQDFKIINSTIASAYLLVGKELFETNIQAPPFERVSRLADSVSFLEAAQLLEPKSQEIRWILGRTLLSRAEAIVFCIHTNPCLDELEWRREVLFHLERIQGICPVLDPSGGFLAVAQNQLGVCLFKGAVDKPLEPQIKELEEVIVLEREAHHRQPYNGIIARNLGIALLERTLVLLDFLRENTPSENGETYREEIRQHYAEAKTVLPDIDSLVGRYQPALDLFLSSTPESSSSLPKRQRYS